MKGSNNSSKIGLLLCGYPLHFCHGRIVCCVSIIVERHGNISMAHYVFQRLGIHSRVRHVRTERVPQQMRRQRFQLHDAALILLPQKPCKRISVHGSASRFAVRLTKQEPCLAVNYKQGLRPSALLYTAQSLIHASAHGYMPYSDLRLGHFNIVPRFLAAQKLMVHSYYRWSCLCSALYEASGAEYDP